MGVDEICGIVSLGANETKGEEGNSGAQQIWDGCFVGGVETAGLVLTGL